MREWRSGFGVVLVGLISAGVALGGCFDKPDETSCAHWVEQLKTSAMLERAIDNAGKLQCKEALPVLKSLYNDGQFQERILQAVKEIGQRDGDALEILRMGLRSSKNTQLAAAIVADWKLTEAKPDLEAILEQDGAVSAREAALDALLAIAPPESFEDALIKLAGYDPNAQSFLVNTRAVEELGKIKSQKAIPVLLKMAFMRNNKGQEVYRAARIALARVGQPALEPILNAVQGEDKALLKYVEDMGVHPWEVTQGPKGAQLLADTLDVRSLPVMLKDFAGDLRTPAGLSDAAAANWERSQINRLKVLSFGFGHIGSDVAVPGLVEVLKDPAKAAINQRINAANALAWIGTEAAQLGLLDALKSEQNPAFRPPLLQVVAFGVGPEHIAALDEIVADPPKDVMDALATNEQLKGYLAVVRECKQVTTCYVGKLQSEDRDQRIKAAVMLARGTLVTDAAVADALMETFRKTDSADTDTRRFTFMGLTRLGDEKLADRLIELADKLEDPNPYWKDELLAFGHWMKSGPQREAPKPTEGEAPKPTEGDE